MSSINKKLLKQGNGQDYPKPGDEVTIEYTGWLQDLSASSNNNKGKQSVSLDPPKSWTRLLDVPVTNGALLPDSTAPWAEETSKPRSVWDGLSQV